MEQSLLEWALQQTPTVAVSLIFMYFGFRYLTGQIKGKDDLIAKKDETINKKQERMEQLILESTKVYTEVTILLQKMSEQNLEVDTRIEKGLANHTQTLIEHIDTLIKTITEYGQAR